jgi:hypothetical protein
MRCKFRNWFSSFVPALVLLAASVGCDAWIIVNARVVDESGRPVSGAEVRVLQGKSEDPESYKTSEEGRLKISHNICPLIGCSPTITLRVSKEGFQTQSIVFDANKDANRMGKGDLTIVLVRK